MTYQQANQLVTHYSGHHVLSALVIDTLYSGQVARYNGYYAHYSSHQ